MTGIGPVSVKVPRVRDRKPGEDKITFTPSILPRYLRKAKSVESTFATVRHRTKRTKGCLGRKTGLAMAFKLMMLLETVLGPMIAWAGVDEVPNGALLQGGSVVVSSISRNAGGVTRSVSASYRFYLPKDRVPLHGRDGRGRAGCAPSRGAGDGRRPPIRGAARCGRRRR